MTKRVHTKEEILDRLGDCGVCRSVRNLVETYAVDGGVGTEYQWEHEVFCLIDSRDAAHARAVAFGDGVCIRVRNEKKKEEMRDVVELMIAYQDAGLSTRMAQFMVHTSEEVDTQMSVFNALLETYENTLQGFIDDGELELKPDAERKICDESDLEAVRETVESMMEEIGIPENDRLVLRSRLSVFNQLEPLKRESTRWMINSMASFIHDLRTPPVMLVVEFVQTPQSERN